LTKVLQKFKHAKEEIRIKTSQEKDCQKREREVISQLKHYNHLYDTVKAERNKYVGDLTEFHQNQINIRSGKFDTSISTKSL
jgi:hypothetical protein